jgi:hypothetical protein
MIYCPQTQTQTYLFTAINITLIYIILNYVKLGPCKAELVCRDRVTKVSVYTSFSHNIIIYVMLSVTCLTHTTIHWSIILCAELFQLHKPKGKKNSSYIYYANTHTFTHPNMHTYIQIHIHTYTCRILITFTNAQTQAYTQTFLHPYTYYITHTILKPHVRTHSYVPYTEHIHACTNIYFGVCYFAKIKIPTKCIWSRRGRPGPQSYFLSPPLILSLSLTLSRIVLVTKTI